MDVTENSIVISDDDVWPEAKLLAEQDHADIEPENGEATAAESFYVASGGSDHRVRYWQLFQTPDPIWQKDGGDDVLSVSRSEKQIAAGISDGKIKIYAIADGTPFADFAARQGRLEAIAFSPNGEFVLSGGGDGTTKLWKVSNQALIATLRGHTDSVNGIVWIRTNAVYQFATASADGTVKIYSASTSKVIRTLNTGAKRAAYSIAFSPDGKLIAAGEADSVIEIWNVENGQRLHLFDLNKPHNNISALRFLPKGDIILAGCHDKSVRLWDVKTGKLLKTMAGHKGEVSSVVCSPNGQFLASGSWDGSIRVWNSDGRLLREVGISRGGFFCLAN